MEAIEIALLSSAMTAAQGNITAASRILGIHRKAVERLVTKHNLRRDGRPGRGRRHPRTPVSAAGRRKKRR
jgi:DNA-binding NtrC family response regulator